MTEKTLREKITDYIRAKEKSACRDRWFPTWWFKFHVSGVRDTPEIRRELQRMKRDGLLESNHEQANNTLWRLIEAPKELMP